MTITKARSLGNGWIPEWRSIVSHNFKLLSEVIEWNSLQGIRLFRISSDLVPFADHAVFGRPWRRSRPHPHGWWNELVRPIRELVAETLKSGSRYSMHPAQFVSLGSPSAATRRSSSANLEFHGALMDDLGLPRSYAAPINIHVSNGTRGPLVSPLVRQSIASLSESVRTRLVFENEQSGYWTPSRLAREFPRVPVTLDYHHLLLNPDPEWSLEEIEGYITQQWNPHRPISHWSEGRNHPLDHSHSEYVQTIPATEFDIELEAKAKDLAVLSIQRRLARPAPSS